MKFGADERAFEAFRERLMVVLDHIADDSKDIVINFSDQKQHGFTSPDWRAFDHGIKTTGFSLFVNTSRNGLWTNSVGEHIGWTKT